MSSQKLPTAARHRGSAQRLFLREKSLRSKNPSLTSITAAVSVPGRKISEYARQLREKQKVRRLYGINETQFRKYYTKASANRGNTAERMLQLLELRLDNVIYRAGFASTRAQARQFASHGWFTVNDVRINIPSYSVSEKDVITVSRKTEIFDEKELEANASWLSVDKKKQKITIDGLPLRGDSDGDINEQLIVEFYSR